MKREDVIEFIKYVENLDEEVIKNAFPDEEVREKFWEWVEHLCFAYRFLGFPVEEVDKLAIKKTYKILERAKYKISTKYLPKNQKTLF